MALGRPTPGETPADSGDYGPLMELHRRFTIEE